MADNNNIEEEDMTSDDYANMASDGIKLMLDNDFVGAEKLLSQHKEKSVHMALGYCYLSFLVSKVCITDSYQVGLTFYRY